MRFKRILLFTFLSVGFNNQAIGTTAGDDPLETFTKVPTAEAVEGLLTVGKLLLDQSAALTDEKRRDTLERALNTFKSAKQMTENCFDLKNTDGEFLVSKAYEYLGDALHRMFVHMSDKSDSYYPSQRVRVITLSVVAYLKASLVMGRESLKSKTLKVTGALQDSLVTELDELSPEVICARITIKVTEEFDKLYTDSLKGTGLTHEGIKTRLERFFNMCIDTKSAEQAKGHNMVLAYFEQLRLKMADVRVLISAQ